MPDEVGPPNGVRPALSGDAIENEPRGLAFLRAPLGGARRNQIGLRAQHDAIVEHLQPVGRQCCAGGRDVDNQFGGAGSRRAFSRAEALDDAVIDNAVS
jgi:hypothetical protein